MEHFPEKAVHDWFVGHGVTLSAAESCTGGHIAARLTQLPGASQYFLGSVVAYSQVLKRALLDVPAKILTENGEVSEEIVLAMAEGVLRKSGSDFALAVSGIAGPSGGTENQPVGTIWAAIVSKRTQPLVWSFHLQGNRQQIIDAATKTLLNKLLEYVKKR